MMMTVNEDLVDERSPYSVKLRFDVDSDHSQLVTLVAEFSGMEYEIHPGEWVNIEVDNGRSDDPPQIVYQADNRIVIFGRYVSITNEAGDELE
jgi:hypothetical protein